MTSQTSSSRSGLPDLAGLARYRRILACYDADPAGDRARLALAYPRIEHIPPPANPVGAAYGAKDLTDYHLRGGDLESWLASQLSASDTQPLTCLNPPPTVL